MKLNANTQKADGLISAQISGFCLGCCRYICPDKEPTPLHFHCHSAAVFVRALLHKKRGERGIRFEDMSFGEDIKVRNIFTLKYVLFFAEDIFSPNQSVSVKGKRPPPAPPSRGSN